MLMYDSLIENVCHEKDKTVQLMRYCSKDLIVFSPLNVSINLFNKSMCTCQVYNSEA